MDNSESQLLNELERLLQLLANVRLLVNEVVAAGSRLRQVNPQGLDIRDRVLIGLAIKAYNCFECLSQDAANLRSEAFHHLKTLAETYIYFQWAGINTIDSRAKLLLAKGAREKIRFFNANPELDPDGNSRKGLSTTLFTLTAGLEPEWKNFRRSTLEAIAKETNADMLGWYNRVYKPSCEPAHFSDLIEYLPPIKGDISLAPASAAMPSRFRAIIAVDYGLQIICDLLRNISVMYELDLGDRVSELHATFRRIRNRPLNE